MLSGKELLLEQTRKAFEEGMCLKSGLRNITQDMASWRPRSGFMTIEQMVRHVAHCKSAYIHQGFGRPALAIDQEAHDIREAIRLLEAAHRTLTECLAACSEEDMDKRLHMVCHGKSAAHFFWIMITHDIWHGGQIKLRERMYKRIYPERNPCRRQKRVVAVGAKES